LTRYRSGWRSCPMMTKERMSDPEKGAKARRRQFAEERGWELQFAKD
jgi:hypothetical protein